jgi:hypothetical protein
LRFGEGDGLEVGESLAGEVGGDFVLDDDVGLEALAGLRDEVWGEGCGDGRVEGREGWGLEEDGYASA